MIQRKQSLFLLLVFLVLGVASNFLKIWTSNNANEMFVSDFLSEESVLLISIPILYYAGALLAFIIIFLFKNRQLQFVLGRLNILINLFLLGALIYLSLTLSGEAKVSEKGIGMFLPIVAILFLVFANKAIKKDEDLVKSVDRLR